MKNIVKLGSQQPLLVVDIGPLAMVVAVLGWWHPPLATSTSSTIDDLVGRLLSSRRFSIDSVVAIGCGEGAIRLDGSASSALHDGLEGLCDGSARQWTARRPRCIARRHTMDWTGSAMGRLGNGRLGVRDVWLGVTRWIGRARKRTAQQLRDEWLGVARGLDLHQWCM